MACAACSSCQHFAINSGLDEGTITAFLSKFDILQSFEKSSLSNSTLLRLDDIAAEAVYKTQIVINVFVLL
jgi:hypothetical protein